MVITSLIEPLPYPSQLYAEIGKVASAWAHFEHELDAAIIDLSGCQKQKCLCILTQFIGSGPRIRAILALCREYPVKDLKLIKELELFLQKDNGISAMRNRIIHDPWFFDRVTKDTLRAERSTDRSKGVLSDRFIKEAAVDITDVHLNIHNHTLKFRSIWGMICGQYPALLGMNL